MEMNEAFEWTGALTAKLFSSDEAREGMSAFLEKRSASWVRSLDDDELT
jgi:1,4-dihydroxy-2-naphthoyl-CoA synthase